MVSAFGKTPDRGNEVDSVAEYQITSWRELPSLVVAREGDAIAKAQLAARLQLAIDEAAMRLGDVASDDYLAGWQKSDWTSGTGSPEELIATVVSALEESWSQERIDDYLNTLST